MPVKLGLGDSDGFLEIFMGSAGLMTSWPF
jgi:hypothetical protein